MHELKYVILAQAKSDFWKAKYDHEAAKKAKVAMRAAKKTSRRSRKKPSASELLKLDDASESEVALDSLGLFLTTLLTLNIARMTRGPARQSKKR